MPVRVLAIELEGSRLRSVSLRWGWRRPKMEGAFQLDLPAEDDEEAWDRAKREFQAWRAGLGRAISIIALLPGAEGFASILHFPFRRLSQVRKIVKAEMEGIIPLPADEMVVEVLPTSRPGKDGMQVLAVAASKASVAHLLERLGRLGVAPGRLDFAPAAVVAGLFSLHPSLNGEAVWLIYRGQEQMFIALLVEGRMLHIRTVRLEKAMDEEEGDPSSEARALALEFQLSRRNWQAAFPGGPEAGRVIVAGKEATDAFLAQLESLLGLPCATVKPGEQDGEKGVRGFIGAGWFLGPLGACVSGLALAGRRMDFLRETSALREGWRELKRPAFACLAAVLFAAGAILGDAVLKVRKEEWRLERIHEQIQSAWLEAFPGGAVVADPVGQLRARVQEQARRQQALGDSSAGGPLDLLSAMSEALPPSVQIKLGKLRLDDTGLSFEGETASFEAVERMTSALARTPGFERAEIRQTRLSQGGSRVSFSVQVPLPPVAEGRRR